MALMVWSGTAAAQVARVLDTKGTALVERSGQVPRLLGAGEQLGERDVINVARDSWAILEFNDQTRITLRPNTVFRLDSYRPDAPETMLLGLVKGGLRVVTGLFGKRNPQGVKFQTTVATIGIRGTEFDARLCEADCAAEERALPGVTAYAREVVARVVEMNGAAAAAMPGSSSRLLVAGAALYENDGIATGHGSNAVLVFRDGARVMMEQNSRLAINRFRYRESAPADGSAFLTLYAGDAQVWTGRLAKISPDAFLVRSAIGVIRPHGTRFRVSAPPPPPPPPPVNEVVNEVQSKGQDAAKTAQNAGEDAAKATKNTADAAASNTQNAANTVMQGAQDVVTFVSNEAVTAVRGVGVQIDQVGRNAPLIGPSWELKWSDAAPKREGNKIIFAPKIEFTVDGKKYVSDASVTYDAESGRMSVTHPPIPGPAVEFKWSDTAPKREGNKIAFAPDIEFTVDGKKYVSVVSVSLDLDTGKVNSAGLPLIDLSPKLVRVNQVDLIVLEGEVEVVGRGRVRQGEMLASAGGPLRMANLPDMPVVKVDPDLFRETSKPVEEGLYVWVRDGAVQVAKDDKFVDVSAGNAAVATKDKVVLLDTVPNFLRFDQTPRPAPSGGGLVIDTFRASDGAILNMCTIR